VQVTATELALAHHEAAHAIAAIELDAQLLYATIEPDPDRRSLGHVRHAALGHLDLETVAVLALTGPAGEELYTGKATTFGVRDFENANWVVDCEVGEARLRGAVSLWSDTQRLAKHRDRAAALVREHWSWISRVARFLAVYRTLTTVAIHRLRFHESLEDQYRYYR
jgi:hypothetical protein